MSAGARRPRGSRLPAGGTHGPGLTALASGSELWSRARAAACWCRTILVYCACVDSMISSVVLRSSHLPPKAKEFSPLPSGILYVLSGGSGAGGARLLDSSSRVRGSFHPTHLNHVRISSAMRRTASGAFAMSTQAVEGGATAWWGPRQRPPLPYSAEPLTVDLRRERVVRANSKDLPVCFAAVDHGEGAEDLDRVGLARLQGQRQARRQASTRVRFYLAAVAPTHRHNLCRRNVANIQRVAVAKQACPIVSVVGILIRLRQGAVCKREQMDEYHHG